MKVQKKISICASAQRASSESIADSNTTARRNEMVPRSTKVVIDLGETGTYYGWSYPSCNT